MISLLQLLIKDKTVEISNHLKHIAFSLLEKWDILSNGGLVQEMAHIANGRDPGNSVSLLRVNVRFINVACFSRFHVAQSVNH